MEPAADYVSNIPPIETGLKQRLIAAGIKIRGEFTLSGGARTDTYFNIKRAYGDPNLSEAVASEVAGMFDRNVTCVAGSGYGGALLAKTISQLYGLYFTFMRAEDKNPRRQKIKMKVYLGLGQRDHGTRQQIEGHIPTRDDVVAVVDDVCTTGGSLIRAAKTLEGIARVSGCFVVIKRGNANSFPYPLEYLFRDTEFLID